MDAGSVRVFYLTSEKMPIGAPDTASLKSSGETVGVYTPAALPAGVKLAAGETAKLIYSDGVVVQEAVTLACTATSTVSNAYVATGKARVSHSHGLSAGCSATRVNGILYSSAWPWPAQRACISVTVNPGYTTYWQTSRTCTGTASTGWFGENAIGSSLVASSPSVNLACSV
ncbi:hypothetical protein [Microbacterium sp. NPDC076911]|uniref:hypothetical protein n=1 Tax=Microbacterium sp. NPDC076911 TaxID=3154958 RepID=UPI0034490B23